MKHLKIFIDSAQWECLSNLLICSRLFQYLIENGHTIIDEPKESDYIIINSCGVVNSNKEHTLSMVQKYTTLKKGGSFIILFGCLMDIEREVANDIDVIPIGLQDSQRLDTIFFQNKRFDEITSFCDDKLRERLMKGTNLTTVKPTVDPVKAMLIEMHLFFLSYPLIILSKHAKKRYQQIMNYNSNCIYIEISRGCTGNCNYCLIKKAKGKVCSRTIPEILKDIYLLYDPLKEVNLVADDCGCYGVDIDSSIIKLLDAIHENFPAIRLKINYLDPRYLIKHSEDFFRIFLTTNITVTMIPLQSGSQKVLEKMNRNYEVMKVMNIIKRIRRISPHTLIFTHFIVGHPGETWNDFQKTLAMARFFDFTMPFVYSNNKGTASAKMADQVSRPVSFLRYAFIILYLNVVNVFRLAGNLER